MYSYPSSRCNARLSASRVRGGSSKLSPVLLEAAVLSQKTFENIRNKGGFFYGFSVDSLVVGAVKGKLGSKAFFRCKRHTDHTLFTRETLEFYARHDGCSKVMKEDADGLNINF